jgi:hypothetical protein
MSEGAQVSESYTFDLLDPSSGTAVDNQPPGTARRDFLRRLVIGGGTLTVGGALAMEFVPAASAASTSMDITILNAALILENLGKDFYADALKNAKLSGQTETFVKTVHAHEVQHAAFVKAALGSHAKPLPTFDFGGRSSTQAKVQQTAYEIEGICTAALVGVSTLLTRKTLKSASTLLPVEAQHVAWISNILGYAPAPSAFNPKDTIAGVEKTIAPLLRK